MKSIKRIGLLLVTGMLAVSAFGCNGGGEAPAGGTTTPAATTTASP